MLFVSFTKGPGGSPMYSFITGEVPILKPIYGITLGDHGVFVLRGDQEVLDGAATFEVSLDPILTTDLFDAFTKTLCVRYDYVTLTLNLSGGSRGTVSSLVVNPINKSNNLINKKEGGITWHSSQVSQPLGLSPRQITCR